MVKNLPVKQETEVQSLSQEDPLEEEMATDSSILAWRIPWTVELGGLQSTGSQRVGCDPSDLAAHTQLYLDMKRMGVRREKNILPSRNLYNF